MGIAKMPVWLLLGCLAGAVDAQEPAAEKVRGFDLETLALATVKATAFSTEYGTVEGEASFASWLRQQGLTLADYDAAYETFLKRFDQDPSGRLEESYFKALDLYTPGEHRPELRDQAASEVAREDQGAQVDAAYGADAWSGVDASMPGQEDAATRQQAIGKMMADSQSRASSTYLLSQEATAQKYAAQLESLRKGNLPGAEAAAPAPSPRPGAPPPLPAAEGALGALHAALLSPVAEVRHAAARPFAWECDRLAWAAPAARDPRATFCRPEVLRDLWLQVAWEIFDAAPQAELHRVEGLLDYLRSFGFSGESRLCLESLRERLRGEERDTRGRLEAAAAPERILLAARLGDLRDTLAAVDRALSPLSP